MPCGCGDVGGVQIYNAYRGTPNESETPGLPGAYSGVNPIRTLGADTHAFFWPAYIREYQLGSYIAVAYTS
jgi:hypothetical protein